jgi:phytoene dehydrogenase-like protein
LEWVHPEVPLAHPITPDRSGVLRRSVAETAAGLGSDRARYERVVGPLVDRVEGLLEDILQPIGRMPRHPLTMGRFGRHAALPADRFARRFPSDEAGALWAGLAAHSVAPLTRPFTTAVGLTLAVAGHAYGWPAARGGSQAIADAMAAHLRSLGGVIETGRPVLAWSDLPPARLVLFDLMPGAVARLGGDRIHPRLRRRLEGWRHGPAAFKVDWALSGPIPWSDPVVRQAGTIHLGGTLDEVVAAEDAPWNGRVAARPFVLVAQQTVFDPTRAPAGGHTAWGYCHVPAGWTGDATDVIEAQVERFAPGFRGTIVARHVMGPADYEAHNPNYVGGDIGGGAFGMSQLLARPRLGPNPYRIADGVFLCSSATPPGAGVHGMSGYHAARAALRNLG